MVTDGSDGTNQPGEWCSVSEAARRLGLSRRGVRDRLERGRLTARATNKGREIFVPASMVAPVEGRQAASGRLVGGASLTMVGPAVLAPDALEKEREARAAAEQQASELRDALAETRISLARAEGQVAALREALADARAGLERERQDREALALELRELRRPLWQRVLAEWRRRRQG